MQQPSRAASGFTLLEVMVVVAIVALLAALAVPSFGSYARRSKTSEAPALLKQLFFGASVYYSAVHPDQGLALTGPKTHCVLDANAGPLPATAPPGGKALVDFYADPGFRALGFAADGPVYFRYTAGLGPDGASCSNGPNEHLYNLQAEADLDGDGTTSFFELAAGSND